jgi:hypothetical protein
MRPALKGALVLNVVEVAEVVETQCIAGNGKQVKTNKSVLSLLQKSNMSPIFVQKY